MFRITESDFGIFRPTTAPGEMPFPEYPLDGWRIWTPTYRTGDPVFGNMVRNVLPKAGLEKPEDDLGMPAEAPTSLEGFPEALLVFPTRCGLLRQSSRTHLALANIDFSASTSCVPHARSSSGDTIPKA